MYLLQLQLLYPTRMHANTYPLAPTVIVRLIGTNLAERSMEDQLVGTMRYLCRQRLLKRLIDLDSGATYANLFIIRWSPRTRVLLFKYARHIR
jgi:hypothetical protein